MLIFRITTEIEMTEEERDLMIGTIESMKVMIIALIANYPDRDGLEAHLDFRIDPARTLLLNSGLTDAALKGFDATTQNFKELFENEFTGWPDSRPAREALKRLSDK
jgi:hypothetical protein